MIDNGCLEDIAPRAVNDHQKNSNPDKNKSPAKINKRDIDGLLLLDKPMGMTSNKALQVVKRSFRARKAGHTGSLDPLATGLLPICLGEYTKFSQYLLTADKQYQVVIRLGVRTDSGDLQGKEISRKSIEHVNERLLVEALAEFAAGYWQVPPMYSAIKQNGKALYKLARQGIEVERKARWASFSHIKCLDFYKGIVSLDVCCNKGTYIRSLADDLGEKLGCGAHVTVLRRTAVGEFTAENMLSLAGLKSRATEYDASKLDQFLLPLGNVLRHLPDFSLKAVEIERLRLGQRLPAYELFPVSDEEVRLLDESGMTIGVGTFSVTGHLKLGRILQRS